jgi:hypothetical protein
MDSDSDGEDIRPNPDRYRTRRRRWYLFAGLILVVLLLALQGTLFYSNGCTLIGAYSGVSFELSQVLEDAARPVHGRACVRSSCRSITVKKLGSRIVTVNDPALSWLPVTVRLTMEDQAGNPIFDGTARVQPHVWQPNGPGCEPTVYVAGVVATRTGRLVPL